MEELKFGSAAGLLGKLGEFGSIHIECGQADAAAVYEAVRELGQSCRAAYVLHTDRGYERQRVKAYLRFWARLQGEGASSELAMEKFGLTEIRNKRLDRLSPGDGMKVQLARVSMQRADMVYLEEPLLNLDSVSLGRVLGWIEEQWSEGVHFVTLNASMRHALLMPGAAFYVEDGYFCPAEREEEGEQEEGEALHILKLAAKSGNVTLLFEPKEIDYSESLNKSTYISVRGTLYQVARTMDELEALLSKSGFFRCHRSYLVNMQKVEQIERLSKNSFSLVLSDQPRSRIPLAKGRVEEMQETFGWK